MCAVYVEMNWDATKMRSEGKNIHCLALFEITVHASHLLPVHIVVQLCVSYQRIEK